jgi:hypothetical protein
MLKVAALAAAVLAAWHAWDREWFSAGLWVLAAVCLTLGEMWWRSARSAWRA